MNATYIKSISGFFVSALLLAPQLANATGFIDEATTRAAYSTSSAAAGSSDTSSFKDAFSRVDTPALTDFLAIGSHTASKKEDYTLHMLFEFGSFQKNNEFGYIDGNGDFVTWFDGSAMGGDSKAVSLNAGEKATLALKNQQGAVFSSVDDDNLDKKDHIVGYEVQKDRSVDVTDINLFGDGSFSFSFDFLAGDLILFIEDYYAVGFGQNKAFGELDSFDNNDMVLVLRKTEIPEPGTMLLLSAGILGMGIRRKKQI